MKKIIVAQFVIILFLLFLTPAKALSVIIPTSYMSRLDSLYLANRSKTKDLVTTGYWSHKNSDGTTFTERTAGIPGWEGENLYKGPCDIVNAVKLWQKSPAHKAILDHAYTYGTISIVPIPKTDECYIVMLVNNP